MNLLSLSCVSAEFSGDAVVETHSDGNQQVALLSLYVRCKTSVHTKHTHVERMVSGQGGESQQRACCGQVGLLNELTQLILGITQLNSVSYQNQRLLSVVNKTDCIIDLTLNRVR